MLIQARHYATGEIVDIVCENGCIRSIAPSPTASPPRVGPALFDWQINGCDGHSFNSERLTVATVRHVVDVCRRHGIGGLCPTLVTNAFPALGHALATLRRACETDGDLAGAIPAIHLEGPYIS